MTTKPRAKTCTLDSKTNRILLITAEYAPAPAPAAPPAGAPPAAEKKGRGGRGGTMVPDSFTILAVGH